MQVLVNFLVKLVVLSAGLVFAAFLLVAVAFFAAPWCIGYVWARLTGRRAAPFVMRVDPRSGLGRMRRKAADPAPAARQDRELADVTDVEAKPPRT